MVMVCVPLETRHSCKLPQAHLLGNTRHRRNHKIFKFVSSVGDHLEVVLCLRVKYRRVLFPATFSQSGVFFAAVCHLSILFIWQCGFLGPDSVGSCGSLYLCQSTIDHWSSISRILSFQSTPKRVQPHFLHSDNRSTCALGNSLCLFATAHDIDICHWAGETFVVVGRTILTDVLRDDGKWSHRSTSRNRSLQECHRQTPKSCSVLRVQDVSDGLRAKLCARSVPPVLGRGRGRGILLLSGPLRPFFGPGQK